MINIYKKTLNCGCSILAFNVNMVNDILILGCHNYDYICNGCKLFFSEESLVERIDFILRNDYKIYKNDKNNWIKIN